MRIRLEKREKVTRLQQIASPALSVLVAFVLIGIVLQVMGYNPIRAYRYLFAGAFGSWYAFSESVLQSIPLMLASLGVGVALSMSVMNIGAEGQYAVGAWAAIAIGVFCPGLPKMLVLPLMFIGGFVAGALWGMIATYPRAKWGVSETITTLMFNYIALQWNDYWIFGAWRDKGTVNLPISPVLPEHAMLATFFGTRVNFGLIIGIVIAIILYFFIKKSIYGYQIRVIGQNQRASRYAGMNVEKTMMRVMLLSGGLAGMAGVVQMAGAGTRLITNVANGAGYTALIIARLSKNNPLTIVIVSLLFGGLAQGSYNLQIARVPWQLSVMLQGAILFCALGGEIFVTHKLRITFPQKKSSTPKTEGGEA